MSPYEADSLTTTLNRMKLLLWRLDLSRRSFSNRNHCPDVLLSADDCRFFKDRNYRDKLVYPDDRLALEQALADFNERRPVQLVFRIQREQQIHWFKLVGWPNDDFRYYDGVVEEVSDLIHGLKNIFEQQNRQMLEQADVHYPVAIFSWPDCTLHKANRAFVDLLGLVPKSNSNIQLKSLLSGDINFPALFETLISDRHINAELTLFGDSSQCGIKSVCRLEHFSYEGQGYLRLALLEQVNPRLSGHRHGSKQDISGLCQRLTKCESIDGMLEQIYNKRELFPGLDAVMFSDIYARKNKVVVYSKGELKEPLEPGSQFPYSGTIAENIEKENLEYLIVEDTHRSIKAIDWMLFVPKGVCSYIAKACYERGAMRTVLIFCSTRQSSFSEQQVTAVSEIALAFHKQLKKIRRLQA